MVEPVSKMSAAPSIWDTQHTELELPEEVDLQLEMANAGSRTLAILIDLAFCGLALLLIYGLLEIASRNTSVDWFSQLSTNALRIALFLLIFGTQWCYFNLFEWFWNGQTPGKRLLHLRVIKVDGAPVSGTDILLRNLSRPIDTFGPMGLIGLLMIFVSRKAQRLGDLMARTLVIHETKIDWSIFDEIEPVGAAATQTVAGPAIRLDSRQWELLHRYLNRRGQLEPEARVRLSHSLVETLKPATRGTELERSSLPPEEWLLELARRT